MGSAPTRPKYPDNLEEFLAANDLGELQRKLAQYFTLHKLAYHFEQKLETRVLLTHVGLTEEEVELLKNAVAGLPRRKIIADKQTEVAVFFWRGWNSHISLHVPDEKNCYISFHPKNGKKNSRTADEGELRSFEEDIDPRKGMGRPTASLRLYTCDIDNVAKECRKLGKLCSEDKLKYCGFKNDDEQKNNAVVVWEIIEAGGEDPEFFDPKRRIKGHGSKFGNLAERVIAGVCGVRNAEEVFNLLKERRDRDCEKYIFVGREYGIPKRPYS